MKAKIFYGPTETGKTRTAKMLKDLFGNDKTICLSGRRAKEEDIINEIKRQISIDIQLIIIDDLKLDFDYEYFYDIIPNGRFIVNKMFEPLKEIYLPNTQIIFITNYKPKITSPSFTCRFDIIEFPNPYFNFDTIPAEVKRTEVISQYFITLYFLMSKNKLEQQLMDAFQRYEHTFIDHSSVADIEAIYNFVLAQYKSNKGRSFVPYSQNIMDDGNICIRMGEQIMIDLTKVEGNFSDLRKEN